MRRAKIVCTIGPASREVDVLTAMIGAGMDVARLNMSHGTHGEHGEVIERVREISGKLGKQVGILLDLSGPKIRLGELPEPIDVKVGDELTFTTNCTGGAGEGAGIPVGYATFADEVQAGDNFSLADGLIHMEALESGGGNVRARALTGGVLSSRKGVNLPTGGEGLPAMTAKDEDDLRFGLAHGVDWVSLSFVRAANDAQAPRRIMDEVGKRVPLMAKVEKPQALECIDEIIEVFDGLMVARGDLGVEIDLEDLPAIQKKLIELANRAAKPVVTATQMLLSMVSSPRPTRAEVTDVANAILDGADAVMLSEESAMGQYPVETVRMMATLAGKAADIHTVPVGRRDSVYGEGATGDGTKAIARATRMVAEEVGAALIITPTTGGSAARLVSSMRPEIPVLALSTKIDTVRQLAPVWGVTARVINHANTTDELLEQCRTQALEAGLAKVGDKVVMTAGVPLEEAGTTNLLRVFEL